MSDGAERVAGDVGHAGHRCQLSSNRSSVVEQVVVEELGLQEGLHPRAQRAAGLEGEAHLDLQEGQAALLGQFGDQQRVVGARVAEALPGVDDRRGLRLVEPPGQVGRAVGRWSGAGTCPPRARRRRGSRSRASAAASAAPRRAAPSVRRVARHRRSGFQRSGDVHDSRPAMPAPSSSMSRSRELSVSGPATTKTPPGRGVGADTRAAGRLVGCGSAARRRRGRSPSAGGPAASHPERRSRPASAVGHLGARTSGAWAARTPGRDRWRPAGRPCRRMASQPPGTTSTSARRAGSPSLNSRTSSAAATSRSRRGRSWGGC